jgi:hypothetical protein
MDAKDGSVELICSFCGKSKDAVAKLIAGPAVYICDECIALCNGILAGEEDLVDLHGLGDMSDDALLKNLKGAAAVTRDIDRRFQSTVNELRRRGNSWSKIGEALGTSRQAAWERFASEE